MLIAPFIIFVCLFFSLSGAVSTVRAVYLGRSAGYASQFPVIAVQQLRYRNTLLSHWSCDAWCPILAHCRPEVALDRAACLPFKQEFPIPRRRLLKVRSFLCDPDVARK